MMHIQIIVIFVMIFSGLMLNLASFTINKQVQSSLINTFIFFQIIFAIKNLNLAADYYLFINVISININSILFNTLRIIISNLFLTSLIIIAGFLYTNIYLRYFRFVLYIIITVLTIILILLGVFNKPIEKTFYAFILVLFVLSILYLLYAIIIKTKNFDNKTINNFLNIILIIFLLFIPLIIYDIINTLISGLNESINIIEFGFDLRLYYLFYTPLLYLVLSIVLFQFSLKMYYISINSTIIKNENINPEIENYNLSNSEKQILYLIVNGFDNKTIAVKRNLSLNTVKTYIKRIFNKTGAKSRYEIISKFGKVTQMSDNSTPKND